MEENTAFHAAIMTLAGNRQLRELSMRMHLPLIMAQVGDMLTFEVLETSVARTPRHRRGDPRGRPVAAAAAMRAHLERAAALAVASREADVEPPPSRRA